MCTERSLLFAMYGQIILVLWHVVCGMWYVVCVCMLQRKKINAWQSSARRKQPNFALLEKRRLEREKKHDDDR